MLKSLLLIPTFTCLALPNESYDARSFIRPVVKSTINVENDFETDLSPEKPADDLSPEQPEQSIDIQDFKYDASPLETDRIENDSFAEEKNLPLPYYMMPMK